MIKGIEVIQYIVGFSYPIALVIGTTFLLAWILGWKKGLTGATWTIVIYAIGVIIGG